MPTQTSANYRDVSTGAAIPVDGIIRTGTGTAPTAGQSLRQGIAIGDGSDTEQFASVSSVGALQVWSFASNAALTQVGCSATSVSLLAANTARKGVIIVNTSSAVLYVAFAATATTTAFTYQLGSGQSLTLTIPYQGAISGIWASSSGGDAVITELT